MRSKRSSSDSSSLGSDTSEQLMGAEKKLNPDFSEEEEDSVQTNWLGVTIAGLVTFLAGLETTVIGISEWPYMRKVDEEATSQFFGFAASMSKVGHASATFLFAYWSYRSQSIRTPLMAGRIIALIGCLFYLFLEAFPYGRRYVILLSNVLFGIASSSVSVLRTYIPLISSKFDRSRAYSATTMANMLPIFFGPLCQLTFSLVSYPGIELIPGKLRFNLFSAPIWVATLANSVSVTIIFSLLPEPPRRTSKKEKSEPFSVARAMTQLKSIKKMQLPWILIVVCWIERLVANLAIVSFQTISAPLLMTSFGWDSVRAIRALSTIMLSIGVLAILVAASFAVLKINRWISARSSCLISLLLTIVMYFITFPYPFNSHPMPPFDNSTRSGCNPLEYSWCDTAYGTWPIIFLPVSVICVGAGLPLATIAIDTIYSRLLGNIDQSMMQGVIVIIEDITLVGGPLYAASMFTYSGQADLWVINAGITISATAIWLICFGKYKNYS